MYQKDNLKNDFITKMPTLKVSAFLFNVIVHYFVNIIFLEST